MARPSADRLRGLYGIAGEVAMAEALIAGGAPVVQLRNKNADGRGLLEVAKVVRRMTRAAGVLFVVNDRLDIALLSEADGVHVGQDDLPVEDVRRVAAQVGRDDLMVGLSTHDLDQVRAARQLDVDYIGFGPVFATSTKENALPPLGLDLLADAVGTFEGRPVVAIGGISLASAPAVAKTGAAMAAVIGDIAQAADRIGRVKELHAILCPGRLSE